MNFNRNCKSIFWSAVLATALGAGPAATTQPAPAPSRDAAAVPPAPAAPAAPAASSNAATQPLRDPTQIDPALAQALAGQAGPEQPKDVVVQITRHGLISIAGRPTVALIEMPGGGSFFVQKGNVLAASVGGVKVNITVESLSPDHMSFTADSKNVIVVVR